MLIKDLYRKILAELNRQLGKAGVLVKEGAIIDTKLVESSRRPGKYIEEITEDRKEPDEGTVYRVRYSEDTEARWVKKANKAHYGYKANVATDAEYGFVQGGHVTGSNESAMKQLQRVLDDQNFNEGTLIACVKVTPQRKTGSF
ncbi:MAG: transposase [Deltaproteobacteria bacterium]|nr:transposase [Deltaproteobacteria bacterium]